MIIFDLIDTLLLFILRIIPFTITLISIFITYYFYKKKENFEHKTTNNKIELLYHKNPQLFDKNLLLKYINNNKSKEYPNYFCNRDCKITNKKCKFKLNENVNIDCPDILCDKKTTCKKTIKENFDNYYCFDGDKCISKNYIEPSKTFCGTPSISQYPNKIYISEEECINNNLLHKNYNKQQCLRLPHGYGWLKDKGCVKGTPVGPIDLFSNINNENNFIPSNPDAYILPNHNFHYNNLI